MEVILNENTDIFSQVTSVLHFSLNKVIAHINLKMVLAVLVLTTLYPWLFEAALIWQWFEDNYGCPETKHALLQNLDHFHRISNKDSRQLRELGDRLMENKSAKSRGHLPGLAFLDTAQGVL